MSIERFVYNKKNVISEIGEEHIMRYKFASKFVPGKKVLDIACGSGYGSKILSSAKAKEVIGLDVSKKTISQAKEEYQSDNLKFYVSDASKVGWPDNYFDVIISFETIEHLNNRENFLLEIKRLLSSEGIFIVSTPNRKLTSCYLIYKKPYNKFHKIEYKKKEFFKILKKYFSNVDFFYQRQVFSLFTPYLIRKPLERIFRLIDPKLEREIYYQADGPKVGERKILRTPTYFIAIAKQKK